MIRDCYSSNDEFRDAFYAVVKGVKYTGAASETVALKRPFAQVNVGTSDLEEFVNLGGELVSSTISVTGVANRFSMFDNKATKVLKEGEEELNAEFAAAKIPAEKLKNVNNKEYDYLAMAYILVPDADGESSSTTDIEVTVTEKDGTKVTLGYEGATVQRNRRTNLVGSFLTSDVVFDVVVDDNFDDDDNNYDENDIRNIFTNGGELTLTEDLTLTEPLVVPENTSVKLNLAEGVEISIPTGNAIQNNGTLIISGNGKVQSAATYGINNAGKLKVSDAEINAIFNSGEMSITDAVINNTISGRHGIYHSGSSLIINGGTYSTTSGNELINNASKSSVIINGGTFNQLCKSYMFGPNNAGITINAGTFNAYESEDGTNDKMRQGAAVVKGGIFNFDPTDWLAEGYSAVQVTDVWNVIEAENSVAAGDAATLQEQITASVNSDPVTILLTDKITVDQLKVPQGANVTIVSTGSSAPSTFSAGNVADITGYIKVTGNLTLKDITVSGPAQATSGEISQFSKSAIVVTSDGELVCENVTFELGTSVQDATAITAWWSTGDGANVVVRNCTFNCAGQRPIRSDACVTVENCVFNDPYRYAVQMTSKASTMNDDTRGFVKFYDNIINAGTTSSKNVVYGVQLEGETYGNHELTIMGARNVINLGNTGKTGAMYYCECGKVDHSSVIWNTEVPPVHASGLTVSGTTYYIASAEGLVEAFQKLQETSDETITMYLLNDIDLTDTEWPVNNPHTPFILDGNGYCISNLNASTVSNDAGFKSFGFIQVNHKSIVVKNIKFDKAVVKGNGESNSLGAVVCASPQGDLQMEKVEVTDSKVENCDRSSLLVTYLAGNSPQNVIVSDCKIDNCEIASIGTAGAVLGYNNSHEFEAIRCVVKNSTISSSEGENKAGILVGTKNNGDAVTLTDCSHTGSKAINAGEETNNEVGRVV